MTESLKCSCGGSLKSGILTRIDLAPIFGLHGWFEGHVRGVRCAECGVETLTGATYEQIRTEVARAVLTDVHILSGEQARFVRKAWLGLTQEQLALRMGINKITVADWERGERPLSKEHDYELRGIALSLLLGKRSTGRKGVAAAVVKEIESVLMAPRLRGPQRTHRRYVIRARAA